MENDDPIRTFYIFAIGFIVICQVVFIFFEFFFNHVYGVSHPKTSENQLGTYQGLMILIGLGNIQNKTKQNMKYTSTKPLTLPY